MTSRLDAGPVSGYRGPMSAPSPQVHALRALSTEARRRRILAAYRRTKALDRCAGALGIPTRTLARMVAEDEEMRRKMGEIRNREPSP